MKDIATKKNTEYLLQKYGMYATKKFGQNFLIDKNIITKIIGTTPINKETCVIEIGPGLGALSEQLSYHAGKVICFEIDTRLKELLKESLGDCKNLEVIFQDFLTVDLETLVNDIKKEYKHVCIVANLPYYITSEILEKVIISNASIDSMHVMVQKEVALKLTDGRLKSPLTYMIDCIGHASYAMSVSKNVFMPAPHIESAILCITKERDYNEILTDILKIAFTQKRKTIANNLKKVFQERTNEILEECHINNKSRPEELSLDDYIRLTKYL